MRVRDEWLLPADPALVRVGAVDAPLRRSAGAVVREGATGVVVEAVATVATGARGFAAALVGTHLTLRRTERWAEVESTGRVRVEVTVTVDDRPFGAEVTLVLDPVAGGARCRVTGTVTAKLPGVGGAVEKRFGAELLRALRTELYPVPAVAA